MKAAMDSPSSIPSSSSFPTLFHEQIAQTRLPAATLIPSNPPGEIPIACFARVEWTATITDLETALSLHSFHVWNEEVVRERFHYDDAPGLHLAFLRVYRCHPGWSFADEPKYGGCRSWVTIPDAPAGTGFQAVLSDQEHTSRSETLRSKLAL